jgi:chitinase
MPRRLNLPVLLLGGAVGMFALAAKADFWSTAYYPGWEQASMPASNVDFAALSHVIHFSLVPAPGGAVDSNANSITSANSSDLVSRAHAAGRKVLICVGGAATEAAFQGATSTANLPAFINNLTNFMAARGYDGIDVDWEPLAAGDAPQFTNLVNGLRSALDAFPQHKMLTAAAGAYPPYGDPATAQYVMFAALQSRFDQINIMTYDFSGPYAGWVTWFDSPLYDGGYRFPSTGGPVPSVDGSVSNFIAGGVAPGKLGIAIAFYGYVWTGGVTQPRQSWSIAPTVAKPSYDVIMASYYNSNSYHWDTNAQANYLSITNSNPTNDMFVSYDDPRTCQSKVSYARNRGLGGVMIWELAQDHGSGGPDPLLQAFKQALAAPGATSIQLLNQGIDLSFTSLPLGSYRIQWTSNLSFNAWNTLTITNVSGSGGFLQITDPDPSNQPQRFYRVKSPP